jgi:hypothetical protein
VIVWKNEKSATGLNFSNAAQLKLRAKIVKAHPSLSTAWLIASESELAIFSSQQGGGMFSSVPTYSDLPSSVSLNGGKLKGN